MKLIQQIQFIEELDKLKAVLRRTQIKAAALRQENSAEHSWHIALSALSLQEHANEPIAIDRVIHMLLIHDLVEIDAGDTFAFAADKTGVAEREWQAAQRIFGLLPEPQASIFKALWQEFEAGESADARFALGIDRLLPLVQNMQQEGGSWRAHQVTAAQVIQRHSYLKSISTPLWQYAMNEIDRAVNQGWLLP
jgi:putative hydrolase of HD superfamily